MNSENKIAILREQMTSLRSEVVRYSDSQRTIARYAILGVAAVIALRKDVGPEELAAFLPIVPIIAMGMVAVLVLENVFIFRTGRWLAAAEKQLNALAGEEFLQYEQSIRAWRSKWLTHGSLLTWMLIGTATLVYFGIFGYLLWSSELRDSLRITFVLCALSLTAYIFALIYFLRMLGELRAGIPDLPPFVGPPSPPPLEKSGSDKRIPPQRR